MFKPCELALKTLRITEVSMSVVVRSGSPSQALSLGLTQSGVY